MRAAGRPDSGFTLIEILVAFTIAVVLVGALYQVFSTGLRSASMAADYSNAILLAESALDAVGAQGMLTPGQLSERVDGKYTRSMVVRPRPDLLPPDAVNAALIPYEVEVRVAWQSGRQVRSIAFATLRLETPP
jgi:general secretion pathway protein I